MALRYGGLGRFMAPKGLQGSARGFNQVSTPGNNDPWRGALKGRKIERESNSKYNIVVHIE